MARPKRDSAARKALTELQTHRVEHRADVGREQTRNVARFGQRRRRAPGQEIARARGRSDQRAAARAKRRLLQPTLQRDAGERPGKAGLGEVGQLHAHDQARVA